VITLIILFSLVLTIIVYGLSADDAPDLPPE
jgi:hypothetical protein